jgi:hypothetical protein
LEFYHIGKKIKDELKSGKSPRLLANIISKFAKLKALDWLKKEKKWKLEDIDVGGTGKGTEEGPVKELPSFLTLPDKNRNELIIQMFGDISTGNRHAKGLEKIVRKYLEGRSQYRTVQMVQRWFDEFARTGSAPSRYEIGDEFGVTDRSVWTAQHKVLNELKDFLEENPKAQNLIDLYIQEKGYGSKLASRKK